MDILVSGWFNNFEAEKENDKGGNPEQARRSSLGLAATIAEAEEAARKIEDQAVHYAKSLTPARLTELMIAAVTAKVLQSPSKEDMEVVVKLMAALIAGMPLDALIALAEEKDIQPPISEDEDND